MRSKVQTMLFSLLIRSAAQCVRTSVSVSAGAVGHGGAVHALELAALVTVILPKEEPCGARGKRTRGELVSYKQGHEGSDSGSERATIPEYSMFMLMGQVRYPGIMMRAISGNGRRQKTHGTSKSCEAAMKPDEPLVWYSLWYSRLPVCRHA
jgi:hypothetical protein